MQNHFKLLEKVPLLGLIRVHVVVKVSCREPEGVELAARVEEKDGRRFLIVHARIIA